MAPATARWLLLLSYAGFVSLGLPDTVLGAAWPAIRAELGLRVDQAGAAVLLTTAGVVLSSTCSRRLRARWGTAAVLIGSTGLAALALWISAAAPSFAVLLLGAGIAGLGGGAIDATLNDHVARNYSARHMNWLHAFWGAGASVAPAIAASVLAAGASWRVAYLVLGAIEAVLVAAFVGTRRSWQGTSPNLTAPASLPAAPGAAWPARASVVLFFCYAGLEAGAGLWAASLLTETRGAPPAVAGAAVSVYWGALCAGRFVIGAWAERVPPDRLLRAAVGCALASSAALAIPGTSTAFVFAALAALGGSLAPIYPLAMHDTPRRFGAEAGARLVGYQVAAASLGVACLPWLVGAIAAPLSLEVLPVLLCALALIVVGLERARRTGVYPPSAYSAS